ncbi:glycosyltransferase family 2 protein [Bacillus taeanensis]|uniref:Glycosyltransferase 2-like domain-containing protein n=1 Tax=Bacillus taeanensis TaxID=273032 RepID=A0A366XXU1_9BACI|nr:glycosyltransferase family 2 protein [Bacillus taeanensis]RBW69965.1 hypothetical protein DS031_08915 [Bacillus taeanensis]
MTTPLVSVIIPACNEEHTIGEVIEEVTKLEYNLEIIVVINGSTDNTEKIARRFHVTVLLYKDPLGHDVGRAIGVKHAKGDILLFLDSDFVIQAGQLTPFIAAVHEKKIDIALNAYPKTITKQNMITSSAKSLLNNMLNRPDLESSSMTNVPHAISRKALEIIGEKSLAIPPLALTKAVINYLNVEKSAYVPLHKLNKKHKRNSSDPLIHLVMRDHLKAFKFLFQQKEQQMDFQHTSFSGKSPTLSPSPQKVTESPLPDEDAKHFQTAALIFTSNSEKPLLPIIQKIRHEGIVNNIIVIDLNSNNYTYITDKDDTKVFFLSQLTYHEIKEALLLELFKNRYFLVLNTDYSIYIDDLSKLLSPLLTGTYDMATMYIKNLYEKNSIPYLGNIYLQYCLRQDKALLQLPWFSPFMLTKHALQKIGLQHTANPFKLYTFAVIHQLKIKSIKHHIPIDINSFKASNQLSQLYIKDLSGCIAELIEQKGTEGLYTPAFRAIDKI